MENNMTEGGFASPLEIAAAAVRLLDDKKGRNIKLLHVADKTILADYFVLCTGTSNTHIKALADELQYQLGEGGTIPSRVEGRSGSTWILLDYSSVIVNIFGADTRNFYNLEKLWSGAHDIDISQYIAEN